MPADKLVRLLRCPIDKTPLMVADESLINAVNEAIGRSRLRDRGDQQVEEQIAGGLRGTAWLYPIRGEIPKLVAEAAISISQLVDEVTSARLVWGHHVTAR